MIKTMLHGIPVSISDNALFAVLASQGPMADARRLSAASRTWLRDVSRTAFASLDPAVSSRKIHLSIHAGSCVVEQLRQIWTARPLKVAVLSRDLRQWQAWSDFFLRVQDTFHLVLHDQGLADLAQDMDLILYEPDGPRAMLPDILHHVTALVGLLVPEGTAAESAEHPLVQIRPGVETRLFGAHARTTLSRLIALARSRKLHEELAGLRKMWLLGATHLYHPDRGALVTTLTYHGEASVQESSDLTAAVGWAEIPSTRLKDVIGHAAAKEVFLRRYIPWLRDPKGAPGMHGVLLWGEPGTGKSLLAAAVAGEAGVPCIHVRAGELFGEYQGETQINIRRTTALARKAPGGSATIILDEVDALAMNRTTSSRSEPGWYLTIVGELLVQLDRLAKAPEGKRVLIVGTCNHKESVDPAFLRSGRLGHHIQLGLPTLDERIGLIRFLFPSELGEDEILEAAEASEGLSQADHADLAAQVNHSREDKFSNETFLRLWEAALHLHRGQGNLRPTQVSGLLKWRMAVHLAGHLVVAWRFLGADAIPPRVHVTAPLDQAGPDSGCLWQIGFGAAMAGTGSISVLGTLLAGRAAEALVLPDGPPGPGGWGDLASATKMAHVATCDGTHPDLPFFNITALPTAMQAQFGSAHGKAIQDILVAAMAQAGAILRNLPDKHLMLALALDREGYLSRRAILKVLESQSIPY